MAHSYRMNRCTMLYTCGHIVRSHVQKFGAVRSSHTAWLSLPYGTAWSHMAIGKALCDSIFYDNVWRTRTVRIDDVIDARCCKRAVIPYGPMYKSAVRCGGVMPSGDICTILHVTLHGTVGYSHTTWRSVRYCLYSTLHDNVWRTRTV
jgi:hypothetical protein